nr:hypothetical protein B0A51_15691 [Rachicladosporium sp. CCFEE 5018]
MRLFLIRHGETVDNVAGLYAGVRDSALTNHGVEQATKLGDYLGRTTKITHIYASPLQRAHKTAQAVHRHQQSQRKAVDDTEDLGIVLVSALIEQDFGYYEGKAFFARSDPRKTGREAHHDDHKNDPGFVDVESRESICKRADAFLDDHLLPLFDTPPVGEEHVVAVVSHGILLSNLWRRLLLRLPRKSLMIAPEVTAARDNLVLEHLGGWSNTGYLELTIREIATAESGDRAPDTVESPPQRIGGRADLIAEADVSQPTLSTSPAVREASSPSRDASITASAVPTSIALPRRHLTGYATTIVAVDSKQHLVGLKRQRGGIGRLAHDEGQKKLDSFFKKRRVE